VSPAESEKTIFEETDQYHKHGKSAKILLKTIIEKDIFVWMGIKKIDL